MKAYNYSEARQQLAELLNCAFREGAVEIRRRDGQTFVGRTATNCNGSFVQIPYGLSS